MIWIGNPPLIGETSHGESKNVHIVMINNFNTEGNAEGQNTIPNADPNTKNTMDTIGERYIEYGESVSFPKIGFIFHKSFTNRFKGMCLVRAKQHMKGDFTNGQKSEIAHYLKEKRIIRN